MIRVSFTFNREVLNFKVIGKEIYYSDRLWRNGVRCIPKDEALAKKIMLSRNKLPSSLMQMFNITEKDKAEYDACNTEEELVQVIIKDARAKGCVLIGQPIKEVPNEAKN